MIQELKSACMEHGFHRRGKAFFRVVGDGVLQVIRCKYQRALQSDVIFVGLFSMYDSLQPQWFTALGCITRYSIVNCFHQNHMPLVFAVPFDTQLDMLRSSVLPWLDTIDTQKKLSRAIGTLDHRWNDTLKIGPYLACGEVNHAKKVIREILAQHDFSRMNRIQYREDADGFLVLDIEQADADLQCLLAMIDRGDPEEIARYLKGNYERNLGYANFYIHHGTSSDA